jgi:hypothetical protein
MAIGTETTTMAMRLDPNILTQQAWHVDVQSCLMEVQAQRGV